MRIIAILSLLAATIVSAVAAESGPVWSAAAPVSLYGHKAIPVSAVKGALATYALIDGSAALKRRMTERKAQIVRDYRDCIQGPATSGDFRSTDSILMWTDTVFVLSLALTRSG